MVPWLFVVLGVCDRMSLRRLECRSASLVMVGGVPFPFCRVLGQVLSPPMGGSASVKIMSVVLCPFCHVACGCVCFVIVCDSSV